MLHLVPPQAIPTTMRAARIAARGGPDGIVVEEVAVPGLRQGDVLVRVVAAAITPSELGWEPTWTNPDGSPRTPTVPSHEVAGVVVAGDEEEWSPGARVFGLADFFRDGAAAEYVAVQGRDLAAWPDTMDAAEAAALPLSALTAWQALFDHGHLLEGNRVLVHGAAGGVGSFAVQLARVGGASVTAVVAQRDRDFVRSLGAHLALDRATAFETLAGSAPFDIVVDTVGGDVLERSWAVLAADGRLVSIAPSSRGIGDVDPRGRFFVVAADRGECEELARLLAAGELRVAVERTFPLSETREAYEFTLREHPKGKVILRVADDV